MTGLSIAIMLIMTAVIVCLITYLTNILSKGTLVNDIKKYDKFKGLAAIPGPKALPFIGNLLQLPKPECKSVKYIIGTYKICS